MGNTDFRILETLSRDLGSLISINELTKRIKKAHGTAYYKNIYDKIQEMKKGGSINISEIGKSTAISLNFGNYDITNLLSEMELKKKDDLLKKRSDLQMIFSETENLLKSSQSIESAIIIKPEYNLKLNRLEFLLLLRDSKKPQEILKSMQKLQNKHNITIDALILREEEFLNSLPSEEACPTKEMLWDRIAFFSPQNFWLMMKLAIQKGLKIKIEQEETNLLEIPEKDLTYNLNRFGYKEAGIKIEEGRQICPEYIITSILLKSEARKINAIPIIIAKNKINYNILIFLSKKYKKINELLGLLKALEKMKKDENASDAIKSLEFMGAKPTKFNENSIKEKMRVYDAA